MTGYLGIVNPSFPPPPESGIPCPSPSFLTPLIYPCLSRGSAGIFVVSFDHFIGIFLFSIFSNLFIHHQIFYLYIRFIYALFIYLFIYSFIFFLLLS